MTKILVSIVFALLVHINPNYAQTWNQKGLDIDGEAAYDVSGISNDINANGDILAIGASTNDGNGSKSGHVRIYEWIGNSWTQKGLDIDGEAIDDYSGEDVKLDSSGLTVIIGAPENDGNGLDAGHARVYQWNGNSWVQKGLDIDGEAANDRSGKSVDISSDGNTIAIGAHFNDANGSNSGHVRIYDWNGVAWIQRGGDIDGDAIGDQFGLEISLDPNGNMIAIGAPLNDGNGVEAGHVRVYEWNGVSWVQKGLDIEGESPLDWFGFSIELNFSSNRLAIGGIFNSGVGVYAGHARVFEWNGTNWVQLGSDIDAEIERDRFGQALDLSTDGNRLAIGATRNNGNGSEAGHVRVYEWDGIDWIQLGLDIDGEAAGDRSGRSVSLSADGYTVAIGAAFNAENGINAGHVRIYSICSLYTTSLDIQSACNAYTWMDGNTYTTDTTAIYILQNSAGCDSVITLNLTINKNYATDVISACDVYTWTDGVTYTTSNNTAMDTFVNVLGCDSIVTLNLTIENNVTTAVISTCDAYTWTDGVTYTASNNTAIDTLTNVFGCDSIVTLDLTILHSNERIDTVVACDSYTWLDGNTYTSSNNTAIYVLPNAVGCDSTIRLHLTIFNSSNLTIETISACNSYTWINGVTYNSSTNIATHILQNQQGCDSLIALNLTIHPFNPQITLNASTITANIAGANYQWLNCNTNTLIMGANSQSFTPVLNGDYAVIITNNHCTDTSNCINVLFSNIPTEPNSLEVLKTYPIPTKNTLTIELAEHNTLLNLQVLDLNGKTILQKEYSEIKNILLPVQNLTPGVYFISLISDQKWQVIKFIKE